MTHIETNTDTSYPDSKTEYYRRMRERILSQIGIANVDQEIKEPILIKIASKVTSVAIGCLETMEDTFGAEVWGYKVPPEIFVKLPHQEQRKLKGRAKKWGECRTRIKESSNFAICDIVFIAMSLFLARLYKPSALSVSVFWAYPHRFCFLFCQKTRSEDSQ